MKYIKLFESSEINNVDIGKIFKIYPTRDDTEMILIAKLVRIIGQFKNWGDFEGFLIYPEHRKGEFMKSTEFISDFIKEPVTDSDLKFYKECEELNKYNL